MRRNFFALALLGITLVFAALYALLRNVTFSVFEPKGIIALEERGLIIHATLLMLIVVVPVFVLAFTVAWRYRASNTKAIYSPNWENSPMEELIWWAIPIEIILVLGALTWSSTHQLDPYKPLDGTLPLQVQVVALDWKWLFIYPSLGIATVNQLYLPVNQPVEFSITSDAPMNSLWIPQLGGQIYAMTGMTTKLHLEASEVGTYHGSSANYSGDNFAAMQFNAYALSQKDFDAWAQQALETGPEFGTSTYSQLSYAGTTSPATYFVPDTSIYNSIVMKYMQAHYNPGTMPMNH